MQLLQHFKDLTLNPKNAKDLKGLILQLAIQGKLTGNWRIKNSNVEPASQLLTKIRQEKKKLIKEKKVRKTSINIIINDDEKYLDIPNNWEWARIIEVGNLYNGNSVNKEVKEIKYSSLKEGYPYLGTKDVNHGFEELEYESGIKIPFDETIFKIAHKNTPLICSEGGSAGKKCGITKQDICFGNKLYALELYGNIEPIFILSLYQTPVFFNEFQKRMTGIIGGISINSFGEIPFPLPPLEEQKEIVRVVEILFKEVEQLEQLTKERIALKEDFVTSALRQLTTANTETEWNYLQNHYKSFFTEKNSIKKLREAVLQLAVQGKLTVDWRKKNPDAESATELLKRIQKEKAQLIKDKKIKKESPFPPISDDEVPYELHESWVWCRVGDLTTIRGGKRIPKGYELSDEKTDHVYIRVTDMKNGTVISSKLKYITEDIFEIIKSYTISKDDLYITIAGTIGDVGEIPSELDNMNLTENAAKLIIYKIDKIFLKTLLRSNLCQSQFIGKVNQMAQPKLALHRVASTIIPLPPLEEQKAIVVKVNTLMLLCDQLDQEIEESKNLNEHLMKSVLREVSN